LTQRAVSEEQVRGFLNRSPSRTVVPILKAFPPLRSREVEEDFMPKYVCVTVCLVFKTIIVWESNKLPCCWHDLQTLESEAMGYENGYRYRLVAPI
jgi:hypothetical protein